MNNRFLANYLINNFWGSDTKFDQEQYKAEINNKISEIHIHIDNIKDDILSKNKELSYLQPLMAEKKNQITKLADFLSQKLSTRGIEAQIQKLSQNLSRLEKDIEELENNKTLINVQIDKMELSIKKLENEKSNLEQSLKPEFQNILDTYIQSKKTQIQKILSNNEAKTDNYRSKLWTEFESQTKDQYPFDDFKDMPEILDELKVTFSVEKNNFVDSKLKDYSLKHSQDIIYNLNGIINNYESEKLLNIPTDIENIELKVNYKDLDIIYKSTIDRNKKYFPHLKDIREILCHPLFKWKWDVSFGNIERYSNGITKRSDAKKFNNLNAMLNKIILEYNLPIWKISKEIEGTKSAEERDKIMDDPKLRENYAKYIMLDKEEIKKLQKIVNLFNEKKTISFKWFENIISSIDNLLKQSYKDLNQENSTSFYGILNKITSNNNDELNSLVDNLLSLVEQNNIWKDVSQQLIMFQNIIWTIYTYFKEFYSSQNINVWGVLNEIMEYIVEKMYIETFSKSMIDDIEQKNNLFLLYDDISSMMKYHITGDKLDGDIKEKLIKDKKPSSIEEKSSRIFCLSDILKKLTHFIVCKNIYDITNNMFLENTIEHWDREACADLYVWSKDFKVPWIDPILISPDKFGIWNWEYMLESYDISDSDKYLAYIRMFNLSDFKQYEKIKNMISNNWSNLTENEKINKFLNIMCFKDKDLMSNWIVLQEFTPLFIHKNFEISVDWINSEWLKYIIWDKNYEMLRTYIFYNFMEANRDHDCIITTPKELISPAIPQKQLNEEWLKIITINPDMPRTIVIPRNTWITKNFEYKRDTIVILNQRCTTWLSWFKEAKEHWKELYVYAHKINDFPSRNNCIDKIRLDNCETYEDFLKTLEEFRKKHANSTDLVVRVETYRSEFEKYEWAKEHVIYKIGKTKNRPERILWWKGKNKIENPQL